MAADAVVDDDDDVSYPPLGSTARALLADTLLPLFEARREHGMAAIALWWLRRPRAAARALLDDLAKPRDAGAAPTASDVALVGFNDTIDVVVAPAPCAR